MSGPAKRPSWAASGSPQLGRWICQQMLRSARTRGLLLLLVLLRRLILLFFVIFRTGMMFLRYLMCAYVVHGFLYCHVSCLLLYPSRVRVWPGFFSGLGWMINYLKTTYGFIRHGGICYNTAVCMVRVGTAWYDCSSRYDNIRSDYCHEGGFLAGSGKFCILVRPAGRAGTTRARALRQAAASLKKAIPQARSAGSTRGSVKNNPRFMVA